MMENKDRFLMTVEENKNDRKGTRNVMDSKLSQYEISSILLSYAPNIAQVTSMDQLKQIMDSLKQKLECGYRFVNMSTNDNR